MSEAKPIPIPPQTREKLIKLVEERGRMDEKISAIVEAVRESKDVPPDYILQFIDRGFEPPPNEEEK